MTPVEWDAWGPPNTRWFRECLTTDWQHALHGMRTAESISIKVYDGMSKATMETLEEMAEGEDEDDNGVCNIEEDVVDDSEVAEVNYHEDPIDAKRYGADIEVPSGPGDSGVPMHRYLRIRDFNPFVVRKGKSLWDESENPRWRRRRVITEATITQVEGAFKKNIKSSLPYTEVVSRQSFDMTDVMMDDCRILLLKVRFSSFIDTDTTLSFILHYSEDTAWKTSRHRRFKRCNLSCVSLLCWQYPQLPCVISIHSLELLNFTSVTVTRRQYRYARCQPARKLRHRNIVDPMSPLVGHR